MEAEEFAEYVWLVAECFWHNDGSWDERQDWANEVLTQNDVPGAWWTPIINCAMGDYYTEITHWAQNNRSSRD